MEFTKEQLSELICKHSEKENGLQDILEMFIQSMMLAERRAYLDGEGLQGNKCNGFRPGRTYGQGRALTFRIPRDRYGNFHKTFLAMPNEESVILLMGRTAMDRSSYARQVPRIDLDRTLFPDEKPPTSEGAPSEVGE